MEAKAENVPDYTKKLLATACRFYSNVVSFEDYIRMLNEHLSSTIELRRSLDSAPYNRLLSSLLVAFPAQPTFPKDAMEGLNVKSVSMDDVLTQVISSILRKYQSGPMRPGQANVLCNGFFFSKQDGPGSMFRNLDVRGPSASVQQLRTPAFGELFSRIGHVVLRHVLINASLLLGVQERMSNSSSNTETASTRSPSCVLLQLSGPVTASNRVSKRSGQSNKEGKQCAAIETDIIIKRDVLYRTPQSNPCFLKLCKIGSTRNQGLPAAHHLHRLPPSRRNAENLIRIIFPICDRKMKDEKAIENMLHQEGEARDAVRKYDIIATNLLKPTRKDNIISGRIQSRLRALIPVLRKLLHHVHKHCFRRLLGRYCPLSINFHGKDTSDACLLSMHSNPRHVAKYLNACIRKVFPHEIFGSTKNRSVIYKAMNHFVCKRNEREHFDVRLFISREGFKVCDVPWLHAKGPSGHRTTDPNDLHFRTARITEFLVWVFRGFVIPLINQSFYVTESDRHRYRLFYYRREVWTILRDRAEERHYEDNQRFEILSRDIFNACSRQQIQVTSALGFSGLPTLMYNDIRFVPKQTSLRGIQRPRVKLLSPDSRPLQDGFIKRLCRQRRITMKAAMRDFGKILFQESKQTDSKKGAAVFGLDDIYRKLLKAKHEWQRGSSPALYVCALDIATSFDTIPLKKLFEDVVPYLFARDRYVLLRYKVSKSQMGTDRVSHRYLTHVCTKPGEETSFFSVMRGELARAHAGGLFSDLVRMGTWRKEVINHLLSEALGNNIVAISRRRHRKSKGSGFAIQRHGLPQGHPMSQLLTSFFYGSIELHDFGEYLGHSKTEGEPNQHGELGRQVDTVFGSSSKEAITLLMRLVDDTLFFSSSRSQAERFLQKMSEESRSSFHGFCINKSKAKTNFATPLLSYEPQRFIPWCGLLIDTKALEIRGDFIRYKTGAGDRLRNTIMIEYDRKPFRRMKEQAFSCFKPKVHPLLFDGQINSHSTVVLNVYQSALLSCLKLCSYAVELKPTDARFFSSMVSTSASNFANLVRCCTTSVKAKAQNCSFPFSVLELRYICNHSYCTGIARKLLGRRRVGKPAAAAVESLQNSLKCIAEALHNRNRSSIVLRLCDKIAAEECRTMWELRL